MLKSKIATVLFVLLFFMAGSVTATESQRVLFTVNQDIQSASGGKYTKEVQYHLKAQNADCPMPKGSVNGFYDFSIAGSESQDISLDFDVNLNNHAEYNYSIERITEDSKEITYANKLYRVRIHVGLGEEPIVIIFDENSDKVEEMSFSGTYEVSVEPAVTQVVNKTGAPTQTGDEFKLISISVIAVISMCFLLALYNRKKNLKQDENE